MNLKIHRPILGRGFCSSEDRYILHWMQRFSKMLKDKYPTIVDEIYEDTLNRDTGERPDLPNRLLSQPTINGWMPGTIIPIVDTYCIVENLDTKDYLVFTVDERHYSITSHYLCDPHCKGIYRAHYAPSQIKWIEEVMGYAHNGTGIGDAPRVQPWLFPYFVCPKTQDEYNISYDKHNIFEIDDTYREIQNQRKTSEKDIKFAFAGSGLEAYRKTFLNLAEICDDFKLITGYNYEHYLPFLSRFGIGASLWGDWNTQSEDLETRNPRQNGEWCYRDAEYLACGIPFIRQEYEDSVWGGSYQPNKHYICIPISHVKDAFKTHGTMGVAQLYKAKYEQVKDDHDFLSYISTNQIDLWNNWFSVEASIMKTIEVVENSFRSLAQ